jgi:hypothetical protein
VGITPRSSSGSVRYGDRPLSDVLAIYPIPGNNYWAMHVIGTSP